MQVLFLDKDWKERVVDIKRIEDKTLALKTNRGIGDNQYHQCLCTTSRTWKGWFMVFHKRKTFSLAMDKLVLGRELRQFTGAHGGVGFGELNEEG